VLTADVDASILELNALREEIVRVQGETLNGQKLFTNFLGEAAVPFSVSLGEAGQTLNLTRADFSAGDASDTWIYALGSQPPYVGFGTGTATELAAFGQAGFDKLLQSVASMLAQNGAQQSRGLSALDQARTRRIQMETADGRISDVDVAREVVRLGRANIQMDATRSVMVQAYLLAEPALKILGG
jgi:flagellin